MVGQQQHVELYRKLRLRKELCSKALPGAAYVPFIGDGDIAVELYNDRRIYGADLDPTRIATASGRLRDADIRVADCDGYPFGDVKTPFAIADFDSYSNPYKGLSQFWPTAQKAPRIVVFGTDGMRQRIKRGGVTKQLPGGEETKATLAECRNQYNFWWGRHVLPYLTELVAPALIVASSNYLRKDMLYWGIVVDEPGSNLPSITLAPPKTHRGKFGATKKAEYLALLQEGGRRGASAKAVGVDPETVRNAYNADPVFAVAVEIAEMDANEIIEDALFEAAKSGNVVACQVWLYNRSPDRWKDQRNFKAEVSGPGGGPVAHSHAVDLKSLTDEELAFVERIVSKTAGAG